MQLRRARLLGIVVIGGATIIVACSSSSSVVETGGFAGSSGVGPVGSTTVGPPLDPPRCPVDPPKAGTSCPTSGGARCIYGPDTRDYCAHRLTCDGGFWEDTTGDCQVQCPKTFAEIVAGTACADSEMGCSYDEGTCGCVHDGPIPDAGSGDAATADASSSGSDGGDGGKKDGGIIRPLVPGVWKCVAPPTDPACPSARPQVLNGCVKEVTCDYGTCALGQDLSYDCGGGGSPGATSNTWTKSSEPPECP